MDSHCLLAISEVCVFFGINNSNPTSSKKIGANHVSLQYLVYDNIATPKSIKQLEIWKYEVHIIYTIHPGNTKFYLFGDHY